MNQAWSQLKNARSGVSVQVLIEANPLNIRWFFDRQIRFDITSAAGGAGAVLAPPAPVGLLKHIKSTKISSQHRCT